MSIRSELRTLVRLHPSITTNLISSANVDLLLDKAQIDLALKGRALPKNEKVNVVASQREYVVSGLSPVLTDNDFLAIDLQGGGVQFYDGSRWLADPEFCPKTREWLDREYPGWRSASATSTPLYWYLDTAEDAVSNLAVGLVDKPSASTTDGLWIHYLSRGKLMTGDTHYPWTGSTTQLNYLEPYDLLLVWWVLRYVFQVVEQDSEQALVYHNLYESGALAMAQRLPLMQHLAREGFTPPPYFHGLTTGRQRY